MEILRDTTSALRHPGEHAIAINAPQSCAVHAAQFTTFHHARDNRAAGFVISDSRRVPHVVSHQRALAIHERRVLIGLVTSASLPSRETVTNTQPDPKTRAPAA
jgi:hypothetical protein